MDKILTQYEEDVFKELINIGLAHSADSFSAITGQQVFISDFKIEKRNSSGYDLGEEATGNLNILITDIMGSVGGKSYLIFTEEEANLLYSRCLPPDNGKNPDQRKTMEDAILMEIDNMLAASVITKFANHMDLSMYGGVPHLFKHSREETDEMLKRDIIGLQEGDSLVVSAETIFKPATDLEMNPSFVWIFPEDFVLAVKEMVKNKQNTSLLRIE